MTRKKNAEPCPRCKLIRQVPRVIRMLREATRYQCLGDAMTSKDACCNVCFGRRIIAKEILRKLRIGGRA